MNVLLITLDDLRPELGCYGKKHVLSPNIDSLADNGVLFHQAYTQQAVCGPSRLSLLTGTRPTGTWEMPKKFESPELATLPHTFKLNGYETISVGKMYHHKNDDPHAWSKPPHKQWESELLGQWRCYVSEECLQAQKENQKRLNDDNAGGPSWEMVDVDDSAYPDGKTCDVAIEELKRVQKKPFFMGVGFVKPHLPFNAPKKYWDLYDREKIELPEMREHPKEASSFGKHQLSTWPEGRAYSDIPANGIVPDEQARTMIHGYLACVSHVDAQIGRLLDTLDQLGLRENTIVALWGDHGFKLNEYSSWCKHTNYEIDTRVPLIISAPDQQGNGSPSSALVETVDIAPTLTNLCGIKTPTHWEGNSMKPLLENPSLEWKDAAYSQFHSKNGTDHAMGKALRTQQWRYVEWRHNESEELLDQELYKHDEPSLDHTNLANDPQYKNQIKALSQQLDKGNGWIKTRANLHSPSYV